MELNFYLKLTDSNLFTLRFCLIKSLSNVIVIKIILLMKCFLNHPGS